MATLAEILKRARREKSAREGRNVTQAEVAAAVGMSVQNYGMLETGRIATTAQFRDLADYYGVPEQEIIDSMPRFPRPSAPKLVSVIGGKEHHGLPEVRLTTSESPDLTPIMGRLDDTLDGKLYFEGPMAFEPATPDIRGVKGAYFIYMPDETMYPRFLVNERIAVNPNKAFTNGDFVVVQSGDSEPYIATIRQFIEWDGETARLRKFNPDGEESLARKDVKRMHRIVIPGLG